MMFCSTSILNATAIWTSGILKTGVADTGQRHRNFCRPLVIDKMKVLRGNMNTPVLNTDRLRIYPSTSAEMEMMIRKQTDDELKTAYNEMLNEALQGADPELSHLYIH